MTECVSSHTENFSSVKNEPSVKPCLGKRQYSDSWCETRRQQETESGSESEDDYGYDTGDYNCTVEEMEEELMTKTNSKENCLARNSLRAKMEKRYPERCKKQL